MGPNAKIYILCDACDYKGTIRAPLNNGTTHRMPCPDCKAKRFIPTSITAGGLNAVLAEREQFRVLVEGLRAELDGVRAELARAELAVLSARDFRYPDGPVAGLGLASMTDAEIAEHAEAALSVADAAGLVA